MTAMSPLHRPADQAACAQLHRALTADELEVHYQPLISLASGLVCGFEALARWRHPEQGLLTAAAFIPQAEQCGLVRDLDDWMLEAVCRQVAEWQEDVLIAPGFRVAVNMSGCEFVNDDIWRRMEELMRETGAHPECLGIELTETHRLEDLCAARRNINSLRTLGVEVSLDDFGTAYATFDQLRMLPFDVLKLDRDITSAADSQVGAAFITAAVELARRLEIEVVAEGIETVEQADLMRRYGCRRGQGWFWSRAIPAVDATELLVSGRFPDTTSLLVSP
jgi:EAL domain-containing protein (putative c-di-GMP-specific phosphodiesterase class I)